MSGYQNDATFTASDLTNLPVEASSSNFAITSGQVNDYQLSFQPAVTNYRQGLTIQVKFHQINTGAATLNIDGLGIVPIRKLIGDQLTELESGDLQTVPIYQLTFDGVVFQIMIATSAQTPSLHGFWVDKGQIDASQTDQIPPGQRGDVYTISGSGTLGSTANNVGLVLEKGDVLHCIQDNNGGFLSNTAVRDGWNVIQSKIGIATENTAGVARFATEQELEQQSTDLMISPFLLDRSLSEFKRFGLNGNLVSAPSNPSTGQEEDISSRIIIPANAVKLSEGVKITVHGFFEHSNPIQPTAVIKRLRLYLGDLRVYQTPFNSSPTGLFILTAEVFRLSDTLIVGYSKMQITGQQAEIQSLGQRSVPWTAELQIRMTIQNQQAGQINTVTRYFWRAEKLR